MLAIGTSSFDNSLRKDNNKKVWCGVASTILTNTANKKSKKTKKNIVKIKQNKQLKNINNQKENKHAEVNKNKIGQ